MKVIKRNGKSVDYDSEKIRIAIGKANICVNEEDKISDRQVENIVKYIEGLNKKRILVEDIQDIIEEKLMSLNKYALAKEYITYRYTRALVRKSNTTDESILSVIKNQNTTGKNIEVASMQRDYIAGEVSRDLTKRILLPEKITKAHEDGVLYFHSSDYFVQPIFNSSLINIGDMLDNGTVINGKMIEQPKSFRVACIVLTQIILSVASSQYGEISIDISHLGKYVKKSKDKFLKDLKKIYSEKIKNEELESLANNMLKKEIEAGIQTLEYQINTTITTNGEVPKVSFFMYLRNKDKYILENAMIYEELLSQRYNGIKNKDGEYKIPKYPKLIYVLDENNILKGGKYDYLTHLAIKCSIKGTYPSYISAKKMKELYDENVIVPSGFNDFLPLYKENDEYKFEGRFNQGLVTLNLVQIALLSDKDENKFFELLDERLELCYEALMCKHEALLGTLSNISPIIWQYGAIARLGENERIDKYLTGDYSTLSLGYVGLKETVKLIKDEEIDTPNGEEFLYKVLNYMNDKCSTWKNNTSLNFVLYGESSIRVRKYFLNKDKENYGTIKKITDKDYYNNSYHLDEDVSMIKEFEFENKFQRLSNGGSISYIKLNNNESNSKTMEDIIKAIYENTLYAIIVKEEGEQYEN